jgi:hypothetical protein
LAGAFYLSTKRIYKREGGYPDFNAMVKFMVTQEGIDFDNPGKECGRWPLTCGQKYASKYRLRVASINEEKARQAINCGRTVIVTF